MTKANKARLYAHNSANAVSLYSIYKCPSNAKEIAADYCEHVYEKKHGYNKRYHFAGTFTFVFSFKFREGRQEFLQYETAKNTYIFKIADIDDHGNAISCL